MTIAAIEGEKWKAVDLDLPANAAAELLTAARAAAQECADDARLIVGKYARSEEAEDQGYAAEMQHAELTALDRVALINDRLQGTRHDFPEP